MNNLRFKLVNGCVALTLWGATETGSLLRVVDLNYLPAPTDAELRLYGPAEWTDDQAATLERELADVRW